MKEIIINTVDVIKDIDFSKEDRLDTVLAESERILNKVNMRLERIEQRHKEIELRTKEIEGITYFIEWKFAKADEEYLS